MQKKQQTVYGREGSEYKFPLENNLYKCALLGSFVLSLLSFAGIPAVLRYGELHWDIWRALLVSGFVLTAVISILFLASCKTKPK